MIKGTFPLAGLRGALSLGRNVLVRNALSLTVLQASTFLVPLVVTPYLARVLGVEQYGMLGVASSIIGNLIIFTDWGFGLSATREVARNSSDPAELRKIFWDTLAAKAFLGLASLIGVIAIIAYLGLSSPLSWITLAGWPQVLGNVAGVGWFLLGLEAAPSLVAGALIGRLSVIPLTLFFVRGPQDTILASAIAASGPVLSAALNLGTALRTRQLMPVSFTFSGAWRQLCAGWHIFLSSASITLYTQLNVIFVGALAGPAQAGLFFGAQKLVGAFKSVIGPVSSAAYPRISSLVPKQPGKATGLAMRILAAQAMVTLGLSLVILIAAPYLITLLLGAGYEGAVPAARWLSGTVFLIGLSNVLGIQIMLPFGMQQTFMRIVAVSGFFNVLSIGPLASYFGATGAAISVLVTEGIVTTLMALAVWNAGILIPKRPLRWQWRAIAGVSFVLASAAALLTWPLLRGGPIGYVKQKLERSSISQVVSGPGVISPIHMEPVKTRVSGIIRALYCDVNSKVRAGETCAKIDPLPLQAAADREKAALAEAMTKFEKDKAHLTHAKALFERDRIRAKRRRISRAALDKAGKAYEDAQARAALEEAAVTQREAAFHAAENNLGQTNIIAPVDGTIVSRNTDTGQSVLAGSERPPLFLIATDLTVMQVAVKVSEKDIREIKLGDKASVIVASLPGHSFKGEVIEIHPPAQGSAAASIVVLRVPNPDFMLKPGMATAVEIVVGPRV